MVSGRHSLPSSFSTISVFGLSVIDERARNRRTQFRRLAKSCTTFGPTSLNGAHVTSQERDVLADSGLARAAWRDRFGIEHHTLLPKASRRDSTAAIAA